MNKPAPLADEYLKSLEGMQPAATDNFYYTRLISRIESKNVAARYFIRPSFSIAVLTILLFANTALIIQQRNKNEEQHSAKTAAERFAGSFNLDNYVNY